MRLAVVGGKLQGTEAVYLAAKAGYRTVLIDRRPGVIASGLADEFHILDLLEEEAAARRLLSSCDAVLPACEDDTTLAWLADHLPSWEIPLLFDPRAYAVSRSKADSDRLFAELDLPRPLPWPCAFPVMVKPSGLSGSEGVRLARDQRELGQALQALRETGQRPVVQEFVEGPSLSLEVVAWGGRRRPLLATGLEFDRAYDCKRVTAPAEASPAVLASLKASAVALADALGLDGVTDVEVMLAGEEPKVIEIDARLPSQTPTVVLQAAGVNIVELLARAALSGSLPEGECEAARAVIYQHVLAWRGRLEVVGEHAVATAGPLRLETDFFGAAEALTDFEPGADRWVATLVVPAADLSEARSAANEVVERMARDLSLEIVPDEGPR
jgi:3-methylornithine--L-lysine ligase